MVSAIRLLTGLLVNSRESPWTCALKNPRSCQASSTSSSALTLATSGEPSKSRALNGRRDAILFLDGQLGCAFECDVRDRNQRSRRGGYLIDRSHGLRTRLNSVRNSFRLFEIIWISVVDRARLKYIRVRLCHTESGCEHRCYGSDEQYIADLSEHESPAN